jgi:hypothetical protein
MSEINVTFTVTTNGWTIVVTLGKHKLVRKGISFSERYEVAEEMKNQIRTMTKEKP